MVRLCAGIGRAVHRPAVGSRRRQAGCPGRRGGRMRRPTMALMVKRRGRRRALMRRKQRDLMRMRRRKQQPLMRRQQQTGVARQQPRETERCTPMELHNLLVELRNRPGKAVRRVLSSRRSRLPPLGKQHHRRRRLLQVRGSQRPSCPGGGVLSPHSQPPLKRP